MVLLGEGSLYCFGLSLCAQTFPVSECYTFGIGMSLYNSNMLSVMI